VGSQQVLTDLQERDLLDVKNCSTFTIDSVLDAIIQDNSNTMIHMLTWEGVSMGIRPLTVYLL